MRGDSARQCEAVGFGRKQCGEHVKRIGVVPPRLGYVLDGHVRVTTLADDGAEVDVAVYDRGEVLGDSGVLREPSLVSCTAVDLVHGLHIPYDLGDRLVATRPQVARRLNQLVMAREEQRQTALKLAAEVSATAS